VYSSEHSDNPVLKALKAGLGQKGLQKVIDPNNKKSMTL